MINKLLIGLIGTLILISCVARKTGFIVKTEKTEIKLGIITNQFKIGYETDLAIIYLGQLDTKKLAKELYLTKGKRVDFKINLDTISKINKDIIIPHWLDKKESIDIKSYDLSGFLDQWILKDLIMQGKVEIWNKTTKSYENKITYHFFKDRLGGESCSYTFQNGKVFHRQLIALGE